MVLLGSHVPRRRPLVGATARGAEVVQVNLSAPLNWLDPVEHGDEDELAAADLPIYVHAPYLVNPASIRPEQRERSGRCLQAQLRAARRIGARGVVVHGGHPTGDGDLDDAIRGWREVLDTLEPACPLLIENTAGGRAAPARTLDGMARLFAALRADGHQVGMVLDTCHAHAAGLELDGLVRRVTDAVGAIDLVHVNDSRDEAGSGRDRHERLGRGRIAEPHLIDVVEEAGAPAVIETPGDAHEQSEDLTWLRRRLAAPPPTGVHRSGRRR